MNEDKIDNDLKNYYTGWGKSFKEYPKREENSLRSRTCKCGHACYHHGILGYIFANPWFSIPSECEKCSCPKFQWFGITTWEERYYKKFNSDNA